MFKSTRTRLAPPAVKEHIFCLEISKVWEYLDIAFQHCIDSQNNSISHFQNCHLKSSLLILFNPLCSLFICHIYTTFSCLVTSHLVTIFPYQTVSQPALKGATGHSAAKISANEHPQNCWFVQIQKKRLCHLQGHSCGWRLMSHHVHPLLLLKAVHYQEPNEYLPNKRDRSH